MQSLDCSLRQTDHPLSAQRPGTVILGPFPKRSSQTNTSAGQLETETWHGKGKQAYRAGLARSDAHLAQALDFVRSNYREAGYREPDSLAPTNAPSVTALAQRGSSVIGTISLWRDGESGLQADDIFSAELNKLRNKGARIGEFGRLAFDRQTPFLPLLAALVGKIALAGCFHWDLTDFLIECNPRHVGFYTRLLGFTIIGDSRDCLQVGAPAVLLHLAASDLHKLASQTNVAPVTRKLRNNVFRLQPTREQQDTDRLSARA